MHAGHALAGEFVNDDVHFGIAFHRPHPRRKTLHRHHMIQTGVGREGVVAGAVPHKHHSLRRRQRRHLLAQGLHQLHIIAMTAQQRRAQRQTLKARAHTLHFANDLLVLVAVDNVQGLDSHILVSLLGQLLQSLQRSIDMNTIALLQFANNHPRGEGAEQRAVRAAGGQIALAGGDVLFAGVVIAGAKAHHQKCFFHILFLKSPTASASAAQ